MQNLVARDLSELAEQMQTLACDDGVHAHPHPFSVELAASPRPVLPLPLAAAASVVPGAEEHLRPKVQVSDAPNKLP